MIERIPYKACPLCDEVKSRTVVKADGLEYHNLYTKELPNSIEWVMCDKCAHVYTSGYFDDEAMTTLLSQTPEAQDTPPQKMEQQRNVCSKIVKDVLAYQENQGGEWLDIGFGDGALMLTAAEFGFQVKGVDLREVFVERMKPYIRNVSTTNFFHLEDTPRFAVVSMSDVLEHTIYPRKYLDKAHKVLEENGTLFLSMPNLTAPIWDYLDQHKDNPYWVEIEHFHNFSRERLTALLQEYGFQPVSYDISQRYRAGMEIIARRV